MKNSFAFYLTGILLGSTQGIAASFIHLSSAEIVLLRSTISGIMVAAVFLLTGRKLSVYRENRRDTLFICLSAACMAVNWLFLYEAYTLIGVSLATVINFCAPVIVIALSPVIFGEKLTVRKIAAVGLSLAGIFLISGQALGQGMSAWGLVLALLAMMTNAAMVIFNKMSCNIRGMDNASLQLTAAPVVVILYFVITGGFHFQVQAGDLLPILWVSLISTGLNNLLYFSAIGYLKAQTVALCAYLEPVSAVILSALILKETMLPLQILGAVLIVGSAVWGEGLFRKKRVARERVSDT